MLSVGEGKRATEKEDGTDGQTPESKQSKQDDVPSGSERVDEDGYTLVKKRRRIKFSE